MKRNNFRYRSISSFKDFRREKDILILKGKILDTKLSVDFLHLKRGLTPGNLISSIAKEFLELRVVKYLLGFSEKERI